MWGIVIRAVKVKVSHFIKELMIQITKTVIEMS